MHLVILHKCMIPDESYRQAGSSKEFTYCKHFMNKIRITCSRCDFVVAARSSYHAMQCTLHVYLQSNFTFVAKVNRGKTIVHVAPQ